MRAARRSGCDYAALGDFENASGVDLGRGARRDYAVVACHLALQSQLAAGVTHQRVEKEDDGERGLKEIDKRVPAFDVRQFMSNHRGALSRSSPIGEVGRQKDNWTKHGAEDRRANFSREPQT